MQTDNRTFEIITPSQTVVAIQTFFCLFLVITGVLGNGIICFLLIRYKALRTIPNVLLANLATVDILNILINTPMVTLNLVFNIKMLRGRSSAWWTTFFWILSAHLNLASMLLLVVNKYFALAHPIKYKHRTTHKKTFCAISAVWIWCVFVTGCTNIPILDVEMGAKSVYYYRAVYNKRVGFLYYSMPAILILLVPIIFLSILTVREVLKKNVSKLTENRIPSLRGNDRRTGNSYNARSASTILIVLLVYAFCFVCGATFGAIAYNWEENPQWLFFVASYAILCGSTCNSFIYVGRSTDFRKALRKTFTGYKCRKNRVQQNQEKVGKVFYINDTFGKKVLIVR